MTWNLSAHGFLGDVTAAEKLAEALEEVFRRPEFGTFGTSFSGPGVSRTDLHVPSAAAADSSGSEIQEPALVADEPVVSPVSPVQPVTLSGSGDDGQDGTAPPPAL